MNVEGICASIPVYLTLVDDVTLADSPHGKEFIFEFWLAPS